MPIRAKYLMVPAAAAVLLLGSSCFKSSCACVTVVPEPSVAWIGTTPLRDSLFASLTISAGTILGSGLLKPAGMPQRTVTLSGSTDEASLTPARLIIGGWYAQAVVWTRTTLRADSLYGIIQLPPGTAPGDTLGMFLRRQ